MHFSFKLDFSEYLIGLGTELSGSSAHLAHGATLASVSTMSEVGMGHMPLILGKSSQEAQKFKVILSPVASSRLTWDTQNAVSKKFVLNKLLVLYTFLVKKLEFISGFLRFSVNT